MQHKELFTDLKNAITINQPKIKYREVEYLLYLFLNKLICTFKGMQVIIGINNLYYIIKLPKVIFLIAKTLQNSKEFCIIDFIDFFSINNYSWKISH